MEPFAYEDYSDFDTDELDFDPSLREATTATKTRRSIRSSSPFELDIDEDAMEKIRSRARQATSDFLDSCDTMRQKAKIRDEDALRKFDAAINNASPVRRASLGAKFLTNKASSSGPDEETNLSKAMPPMVPRQSSLRVRHRSPHLPPPPPPPGTSTTSSVMNEINALEAFARDTRASPVRGASLAPGSTAEPRRSAPCFTTTPTEPDIRERISTRRKMRDVESRLDKILDYELPYASGFKEMRNTLREINDKMAKHRLLIDRYSGLQMNESNEPVADRVAAKVDELVPRVPALSGVQNPFKPRSDEVTSSFDPRLIPGYSTGLCVTPSEGTAELRGRIRNLLCRTRETSRQDAANPHLRPFSTNHRKAGVVAE
ncbi:unnamed protein product [Taenia asiatica]|uniref:Uncharacterized protein n=1 Tax=Taenia asiatica TaxID=60517 RepID=A0A0R3WAX1_TAEAS|nr:unnamed protein product [Taenia asiatica]